MAALTLAGMGHYSRPAGIRAGFPSLSLVSGWVRGGFSDAFNGMLHKPEAQWAAVVGLIPLQM